MRRLARMWLVSLALVALSRSMAVAQYQAPSPSQSATAMPYFAYPRHYFPTAGDSQTVVSASRGFRHHGFRRFGWGYDSTLFYSSGSGLIVGSGTVLPIFIPYAVAYPTFVPVFPPPVFAPPPLVPAPAADAPLAAPAEEPPAKRKIKATNAVQRAKAGKFIGFGDGNFGKQKYMPAIERYKTAAQMAPDMAEAYFRQAFAMAALGQYENAAKTFRRGLAIRAEWAGAPFRLDDLYGDNQLAKRQHQEHLAKAIEANPVDSNLLMVLGLQLYFDGHQDRAAVFFARVAQLGGNDDHLLDGFLPKPAPAGAAPPKGNPKVVF